jgi:hypothetical protein
MNFAVVTYQSENEVVETWCADLEKASNLYGVAIHSGDFVRVSLIDITGKADLLLREWFA